MCGIAGIVTYSPQLVKTDDLKKMTDVIAHRVPDGEGHWVKSTEQVGFGTVFYPS